jgi:C-terminal processing protease CtpA/Prc
MPGDQVLTVDGENTEGWDGEVAAQHLRGAQGSAVWVKVARSEEESPVVVKQFRCVRVFLGKAEWEAYVCGYT